LGATAAMAAARRAAGMGHNSTVAAVAAALVMLGAAAALCSTGCGWVVAAHLQAPAGCTTPAAAMVAVLAAGATATMGRGTCSSRVGVAAGSGYPYRWLGTASSGRSG
jgi:hypothetical protein